MGDSIVSSIVYIKHKAFKYIVFLTTDSSIAFMLSFQQ